MRSLRSYELLVEEKCYKTEFAKVIENDMVDGFGGL